MVDVRGSAVRIYRRLIGVKPPAAGEHPGFLTATDGVSAVAVTEACIAEAAGLGGGFPGTLAATRFDDEARRGELNQFHRPLAVVRSGGGREGLASALGMSAAGLRATAFLSGQDLAESIDLVRAAAGRRLPVVVHVAARAATGRGVPAGTGHEAIHAAADSGALVVVASTVQEAADFALIARRTAEATLAPALVVMDGPETALSVQDVYLASPDLAARYLGDPGEQFHPATAAQALLFGRHRRRVPRWHDLENPVLSGALTGTESHAVGEAARRAFLDPERDAALGSALEEFARDTARRHDALVLHRTKDASILLVGMGSVIEPLTEAADRLRARKVKAGVAGIRALRPFPAAALAAALAGKRAAAVVERLDAPCDIEAPLLREIRSVLARALENGAFGETAHPGLPKLESRQLPRLVSVYAGLGGHPVRPRDLDALAEALQGETASPVYLGVDFAPDVSGFPKRQAVLDALRRDYPQAARLGLSGRGDDAGPSAAGALTLAVHRAAGRGGESFVSDAGLLLHRISGGSLRTRPGISWERWDASLTDLLHHAPEGVRDPGDDAPADVALWHPQEIPPRPELARRVRSGGCVLVETAPATRSVWESLPPALRVDLKQRGVRLYVVRGTGDADPAARSERLLGATIGVLRHEGRLDLNNRKLLGVRRELLEDADESMREARIAAFQAGLDLVMPVETGSLGAPTSVPAEAETETPLALRHLGRAEDALDRLQKFWDQVGIFYREGDASGLSPDPVLAAGTIPSLSSTFRDHTPTRDILPAFDPTRCTACGDCWSTCPDSAIGVSAVGAGPLIEAAMKAAKARGANAEPLRMAVSKLAARVNETLAVSGGGPAGPLFDAAFADLMKKLPLPEERKQPVEEAFAAVREVIAEVPVARTAPFFTEAEAEKKGSGSLFTLGINPQACKGCGVCVEVCDHDALRRDPQTKDRVEGARALWHVLAELPDPTADLVERARGHAEVGPLAGALLQREARLSLAGGDGAEAGSGEKTVLRQVLAAAEYHLGPRSAETIREVEELREELGAKVRELLSGALPTSDLEALARGIESFDRPDTDLAAFTSRVEAAFDTGRVDLTRLRLLVDTAQKLAEFHRRLTVGAGGLGRVRFGIVAAPGDGLDWIGAFPHNPFHVPVTVHPGPEAAAVARGILEGQFQEVLEGVRILRRARLALERPAEVRQAEEALAALTWRDLTAEERRLAPALFLVGTDASLGASGWAGLAALLDDALPVKVLLLSSLDDGLGLPGGATSPAARTAFPAGDPSLLALGHARAYVAQSSIAHGEHLERAVAGALAHEGPALLRVHAPRPEAHGFARADSVRRAAEAVGARALPLFRFTPGADATGAATLDLEGNPEPEAGWTKAAGGNPFTFAHWAAGESRFARHFTAAGDAGEGVPIEDYVLLRGDDRRGKFPTVDVDGNLRRVSTDLARVTERRLVAWRTLQRLAGRKEVDAQAVEEAVAAAAASAKRDHEARLAGVRQEYEARLQAVQREFQVRMAHRVRDRLLALVNRTPTNGGGTANS